ncbi:hypothetical protein C1T17_15070 [Sphingobium sp. SCG-1]|uniref:hypothetical protein n=1 Tax=Sphingobium sp. SCG-1 TaxID=2072936 RepID=UPI000CD67EEE|nr:hypothetical protein [Sphingobium sp. SCG-1]AUW59213.1 hypothetical protein C1T17_15070 [Sphingobium sp. SCG-1]
MLAISTALMLMLAGTPEEDMGAARKAYAKCLQDFTTDARDRKVAAADYKSGLKSKCADKEAAFRTAILAADKADGMKPDESAKDADDQIKEYLDKFGEDYEG